MLEESIRIPMILSGRGDDELYDLDRDPREQDNVLERAENSGTVQVLDRRWSEHHRRSNHSETGRCIGRRLVLDGNRRAGSPQHRG